MQRQSVIVGAVFGPPSISDKIVCYLAGELFDLVCYAMTCKGICHNVIRKVFGGSFHWEALEVLSIPVSKHRREKCLIDALIAHLAQTRKAFLVHIFTIFLEEVKLLGYETPPDLDLYSVFASPVESFARNLQILRKVLRRMQRLCKHHRLGFD